MSSPGSGPGDVFDVRKIRKLVELMNEHDLSEIDLAQGDSKVRLCRGAKQVVPQFTLPAGLAAPQAAAAAPAASGGSAGGEATAQAAHIAVIKSPMVGTFYTSPNPDSPAFVKVGDSIGPETTVCIVEAMKVFNEIPAECAGKIVAVLVQNGQPVEYNQPLFKVDTSH
jgi:acetyl-CoA carboxylase biotin carboxyl carrier protein